MTLEDFAIKDYELKVRYLTDHLGRMWPRFNFMLGIQTTLAGGKFFLGDAENAWPILCIGFVFASMWYILGAQDRYLVELYRKQVASAHQSIIKNLTGASKIHVGQVEAIKDMKVDCDWFTWRNSRVSSTKMAAIVPLVIAVLWVALAVYDILKTS